jgi:hypothetical protein
VVFTSALTASKVETGIYKRLQEIIENRRNARTCLRSSGISAVWIYVTLKTVSIACVFSGENTWAAAAVCLIAVIGI